MMFRGDRRQPIVRDDADRETVVRSLAEASNRSGFRVHAFVLTTNFCWRLRVRTFPGELDGCRTPSRAASTRGTAFEGISLEAATKRFWPSRETASGPPRLHPPQSGARGHCSGGRRASNPMPGAVLPGQVYLRTCLLVERHAIQAMKIKKLAGGIFTQGQRTRMGSTFTPGLRPSQPSNAILLSRSEGKAQARFRAGSHGAQDLIGPSVER